MFYKSNPVLLQYADFFPTRFFLLLKTSSLLSLLANFTMRRFLTFFVSGNRCAVEIQPSSSSTPMSDPNSFTSCFGLSAGSTGMPVTSKQPLLIYCWVWSTVHSISYNARSNFSIRSSWFLLFTSSSVNFLLVKWRPWRTLSYFAEMKPWDFSIASQRSVRVLMIWPIIGHIEIESHGFRPVSFHVISQSSFEKAFVHGVLLVDWIGHLFDSVLIHIQICCHEVRTVSFEAPPEGRRAHRHKILWRRLER